MAEPNEPWNKGRKLPPEPLSTVDIGKLIKACSARAPTGVRNRALIAVLYRAGLRLDEALSMWPKDLDLNVGTIRVLHGKGDKCRVVGMDEGAWGIVQRWLDKRIELGINGRQPVFCTLKGKPLAPSYVRSLMPRLAKKASIERRVHAHGLRHSHAFELANEGHPVHLIQQQLGHSCLGTTDRYIRHLAPQQVIRTMQGRKWSL